MFSIGGDPLVAGLRTAEPHLENGAIYRPHLPTLTVRLLEARYCLTI